MEKLKYWLWLSKINVNEKLKKDLIVKYKDPEKIFNLTKKQLITEKITSNIISEILDFKHKADIEKYEKYIIDNKIGILNIFSERYPKKLLHIYDSPVVLFYKGNIKLLEKQAIAIVGSRECSIYGKKVTERFSKEISRNNICVISGLAKGIDTYSHLSSLKENGRTIAIIGTGIDKIYPRENTKLAEEIIKNQGLILSEYIIGEKPKPSNFPKRNRIISALSDGVLVVEATRKSGALITADFALEHGKEVYAVPGNITSYNSYGTNELIKQGAKGITNVNDILEDLYSEKIEISYNIEK